MSYLIVGLCGVHSGFRSLALRRRQLAAAGGPSPRLILRPAVLAVVAGIAFSGGALLMAAGGLVLVQG
ncbi:hypothetical protein KMT30_30930 [Streptomyces sp. IBSBF 2953]|nr:hypothetical protein [Streptomyces hayashii]